VAGPKSAVRRHDCAGRVDEYFAKLCRYSRSKLKGMPLRAVNEEDVALSASMPESPKNYWNFRSVMFNTSSASRNDAVTGQRIVRLTSAQYINHSAVFLFRERSGWMNAEQ
jgi:hypothetical protein